MTTRCIRCQVLEVPAHDDWQSQRRGQARDLLPWADPYISSLVQRLEERYDAVWTDEELSDPFAADDAADFWANFESPSAAWQEDAFMPRPLELDWQRNYLPTFGGFPLLDDAGPADDAGER